jgi:hypothetical protein
MPNLADSGEGLRGAREIGCFRPKKPLFHIAIRFADKLARRVLSGPVFIRFMVEKECCFQANRKRNDFSPAHGRRSLLIRESGVDLRT